MEISKMLLIELQEGDSNKGGVSYAGERLVDFLLETDHLHLIDEEGGFDEINSLLSECGIKPIDFSEEFGLNSLESKLIQEKTFGVTLYYSTQKDSDATPIFTEKELVSVANELLINSSEDDVESFTSVEDAINYLEEVAEWNPIKEYSQYFKQSELEEVK